MEMIGVVVLVLLLIGIMFWYCHERDKKRGHVTAPSGPVPTEPPLEHQVVGAILPQDTEDLVLSSLVSYGPRLEQPVGTLLLSSAPDNVRKELLTSIPISPVEEPIDLPETFDAREKWPGAISEAYQQGQCGSCWAFSSATAVADRFRIANPDNKHLRTKFMYRPFSPDTHYPVKNSLSPYQMVSCNTCEDTRKALPLAMAYQDADGIDTTCNHGCEGGFLEVAYEYIRIHGLNTLIDTPAICNPVKLPQGVTCPCETTEGADIYRAKRVYSLTAPDEPKEVRKQKIMQDVFLRGPVTIGYIVYTSFRNFFDINPAGVYTDAVRPQFDKSEGGHAVDIVGWGTDPTGVFYWLIRNSWGEGWGDGGFFRMQYDMGGAINESVMAADVEGPKE